MAKTSRPRRSSSPDCSRLRPDKRAEPLLQMTRDRRPNVATEPLGFRSAPTRTSARTKSPSQLQLVVACWRRGPTSVLIHGLRPSGKEERDAENNVDADQQHTLE